MKTFHALFAVSSIFKRVKEKFALGIVIIEDELKNNSQQGPSRERL